MTKWFGNTLNPPKLYGHNSTSCYCIKISFLIYSWSLMLLLIVNVCGPHGPGRAMDQEGNGPIPRRLPLRESSRERTYPGAPKPLSQPRDWVLSSNSTSQSLKFTSGVNGEPFTACDVYRTPFEDAGWDLIASFTSLSAAALNGPLFLSRAVPSKTS